MNYVFLSPHYPPNYYLFCVQLNNFGASVLGIAEAPKSQLSGELQNALTDYYQVNNMENYEELLRACGYFTFHYGKLDRIDSHNEHWLEKEAALRTDFNIHGIKSDKVAYVKLKSLMKEKFREAGIAVARGELIPTLKKAQQLIQEFGYPVVVKPNKGVGAVATYKLHNDEELYNFFSRKPAVDYIMEEFIDGEIQSFDGLVDRDGNIVFYTVHCDCDTVMDVILEDRHTAYYSLREIPEDIRSQGTQMVEIFGIRERFFHIEFFRTSSGNLVALEVNMRPPGGLTMDMFNYANDIDLYYEWANVALNNRFSSSYQRKYHCGYISRKYSKNYLYTHYQILEHYQSWLVHHTTIEGIFQQVMGNYGYLVRTTDLDKFFEIKNFIHKLAE